MAAAAGGAFTAAAVVMLGVRLAGCGILALEAESKNAVNILHELVYLASCGFISLHIGVRHDLSVDLTEFLVICLELLLILILLGSLMLEGHLNKLDLGDKPLRAVSASFAF